MLLSHPTPPHCIPLHPVPICPSHPTMLPHHCTKTSGIRRIISFYSTHSSLSIHVTTPRPSRTVPTAGTAAGGSGGEAFGVPAAALVLLAGKMFSSVVGWMSG